MVEEIAAAVKVDQKFPEEKRRTMKYEPGVKKKDGFRLSVASFEDKQEAMEIVDRVLAPVLMILNRWAGDPLCQVPIVDREFSGEVEFFHFQELLEQLDFSEGDSWSLLSLIRLKRLCGQLQGLAQHQGTSRPE